MKNTMITLFLMSPFVLKAETNMQCLIDSKEKIVKSSVDTVRFINNLTSDVISDFDASPFVQKQKAFLEKINSSKLVALSADELKELARLQELHKNYPQSFNLDDQAELKKLSKNIDQLSNSDMDRFNELQAKKESAERAQISTMTGKELVDLEILEARNESHEKIKAEAEALKEEFSSQVKSFLLQKYADHASDNKIKINMKDNAVIVGELNNLNFFDQDALKLHDKDGKLVGKVEFHPIKTIVSANENHSFNQKTSSLIKDLLLQEKSNLSALVNDKNILRNGKLAHVSILSEQENMESEDGESKVKLKKVKLTLSFKMADDKLVPVEIYFNGIDSMSNKVSEAACLGSVESSVTNKLEVNPTKPAPTIINTPFPDANLDSKSSNARKAAGF